MSAANRPIHVAVGTFQRMPHVGTSPTSPTASASVPIRRKASGCGYQLTACNQATTAAKSRAGHAGRSSPTGQRTAQSQANHVNAATATAWSIGQATRVEVLTGRVNVQVGKAVSRPSSGPSRLKAKEQTTKAMTGRNEKMKNTKCAGTSGPSSAPGRQVARGTISATAASANQTAPQTVSPRRCRSQTWLMSASAGERMGYSSAGAAAAVVPARATQILS